MPIIAEMSDIKTAREVQNAFSGVASREPKSLPVGNPELEELKRPLCYPSEASSSAREIHQ